jgi:glucosylceramidase
MFGDKDAAQYYDGTAVHWYASTFEYFPEALQYAHSKAPNKHLIQTEGCIDAEVPRWKNDEWYWSAEAKDWGWTWAPEHQKHLHPKYVPVFRYARDMIGCLNNWVDGWIDWNMVLNKQGGPNWAKNWCTAPVIVDVEKNEVYFTPLYYTIAHFSKFIRPGSKRIGFENANNNIMVTAAENPDKSIAVVIFNPNEKTENIQVKLADKNIDFKIQGKAIQTLLISQNSNQAKKI